LGIFQSIFIENKLINLSNDADFYKVIEFILRAHGGPDSLLLAQSELLSCHFFISNDGDLVKDKLAISPESFCSRKIKEQEIRNYLMQES
jgi:hypothetical protein